MARLIGERAMTSTERSQKRRALKAAEKVAAQPKPPPRGRRNAANSIIEYAHTLTCPFPPLAGQRFKLGGWQQRFLRKALASGVQRAGLSCARKNGKSGLIAVTLAAYLVGPLNTPHWRGVVVSLNARLSALLLEQTAGILAASGLDNDPVKVKRSTPGSIHGLNGAVVEFLANDPSSGHGTSADLAIIDEAGLMSERDNKVWMAVEDSLAARSGRLICISVRGYNQRFGDMAERAKTHSSTYFQEHAAPEGASITDRKAWRAANPGLAGGIKSLGWLKGKAKEAALSTIEEAEFRAMHLNQPGSPEREIIVSLDEWKRCLTDDPPPRSGPVMMGIDLGGPCSMTAAAAVWPDTGRLELWGAFGSNPDLKARGQSDAVGSLYEVMARRQELMVLPGRVTPVDAFLQRVVGDLEGENIEHCGADRFRYKALTDALDKSGVFLPMVWRATGGTKLSDAAFDVGAFQTWVKTRKLACVEHIGMAAAIRESAIDYDYGNARLNKQRQKSRIDMLQAAVIAVGLAQEHSRENDGAFVGVF